MSTFSGLSDPSGPSFGRRVAILETLAKYRSCVVMLDLECDDLVNEMFSTFFAVARLVYLILLVLNYIDFHVKSIKVGFSKLYGIPKLQT